MIDIKTQCIGKESSVLIALGIPQQLFNGKHQPCIFCEGKDRARWVRDKAFYICNQCGSKSFMNMAIDWLNMPFKDATTEIRKIIGTCKMTEIKAPDTAANESRIKKIHAGLKRMTGDCIASRYLAGRGITVLPERDCYFHPAIGCYEGGVNIGDLPAMVSVIRTPGGEVASYHITYLRDDCKKADVVSPRKILPTINLLDGASIPLFTAFDTLCIAEGVESALSVHMDTGLPVWAAVNAGMMEKIVVPESVKHVYIYADEDKSFRGAKAAYTLANKLMAQGKEVVRVIRLADRQQWVDAGDSYDMNDFIIANRVA